MLSSLSLLEFDKLWLRLVLLVTRAAFPISSTSKGVHFLILSQYESMLGSADHLLHSSMGKSRDLSGFLNKRGVALSTLAFVELALLASTPSVEFALRVDGSSMEVSAADVDDVLTGHVSLNQIDFVWIACSC